MGRGGEGGGEGGGGRGEGEGGVRAIAPQTSNPGAAPGSRRRIRS